MNRVAKGAFQRSGQEQIEELRVLATALLQLTQKSVLFLVCNLMKSGFESLLRCAIEPDQAATHRLVPRWTFGGGKSPIRVGRHAEIDCARGGIAREEPFACRGQRGHLGRGEVFRLLCRKVWG